MSFGSYGLINNSCALNRYFSRHSPSKKLNSEADSSSVGQKFILCPSNFKSVNIITR